MLESRDPAASPSPRAGLAQVTIYGAGITGLTAAHELIERGFQVRVVEAARERGADGRERMAIGGIARTQYGRAPRPRGGPWRAPADREVGADDRDAGPLEPLRICVRFAPRSHALDERGMAAAEQLLDALEDMSSARLRVTGFAGGDDDFPAGDGQNRVLARRRAEAVRAFLAESCGVDPEQVVTHAIDVEADERGRGVPRAWQTRARAELRELLGEGEAEAEAEAEEGVDTHERWAVIERDDVVLPGEHGFRFFPSYYRHVFDTLRRIPLLDARGEETGRTVFDRVVSATMQGVAEHGQSNPIVTPRTPPESDLTMTKAFTGLLAKGYSWRDLQQFLERVLRYMATCPRRRAAEYESLSWWDYLRAVDPQSGRPRYRYSAAFERDVKFSAKVLAAFNAEWGDARTNGSTYVQLLLNSLIHRDKINGCLDGPTTEAWFAPWRRQLERLGVRFVPGRLVRVERDARGRVRPMVTRGEEPTPRPDEEADYYLVATDVITAEAVTRSLPQVGVPGQLAGYATTLPPRPGSEAPEDEDEAAPTPRDPYTDSGRAPWDRLQTLSGIQYFFTTDVKLVRGHMYFGSAEWALSSINQQQFWTRRPFVARDGYSAVLSVDIGAFDRPSTHPPLNGRTAWDCTREELAAEVWRQICEDMGERASSRRPLQFPQPVWYHVDTLLVYGDREGDGRLLPVRNEAPFLIPIVGDWARRPGGDPWSPSRDDDPSPRTPDASEIWQAPHGGYWVHWDSLVFAGTYKRTFTRMTTMESANESARHAVNAILDHFLLSPVAKRRREARLGADPRELRGGVPSRAVVDKSEETGDDNTRLWRPAAPDEAGYDLPYRSTLLGDYCQIWNMEDYELPELDALRAHDERRFERGQPHAWESGAGLGLGGLGLTDIGGLGDLGGLVPLLSSLGGAREGIRIPTLQESLSALDRIRDVVERELRRAYGGDE